VETLGRIFFPRERGWGENGKLPGGGGGNYLWGAPKKKKNLGKKKGEKTVAFNLRKKAGLFKKKTRGFFKKPPQFLGEKNFSCKWEFSPQKREKKGGFWGKKKKTKLPRSKGIKRRGKRHFPWGEKSRGFGGLWKAGGEKGSFFDFFASGFWGGGGKKGFLGEVFPRPHVFVFPKKGMERKKKGKKAGLFLRPHFRGFFFLGLFPGLVPKAAKKKTLGGAQLYSYVFFGAIFCNLLTRAVGGRRTPPKGLFFKNVPGGKNLGNGGKGGFFLFFPPGGLGRFFFFVVGGGQKSIKKFSGRGGGKPPQFPRLFEGGGLKRGGFFLGWIYVFTLEGTGGFVTSGFKLNG